MEEEGTIVADRAYGEDLLVEYRVEGGLGRPNDVLEVRIGGCAVRGQADLEAVALVELAQPLELAGCDPAPRSPTPAASWPGAKGVFFTIRFWIQAPATIPSGGASGKGML